MDYKEKTMTNNTKKVIKEIDKSEIEEIIDFSSDLSASDIDLTSANLSIKPPESLLIDVKSQTFGKLIFKNPRINDKIVWKKCGETQQLMISDLRAIKLNSPKFFENNRVLPTKISEEQEYSGECTIGDIYKLLGITRWYKNLIDPTDYNGIAFVPINEIPNRVALLTPGAKESLTRAIILFAKKGVIDSRKVIAAWEKALNIKLEKGLD